MKFFSSDLRRASPDHAELVRRYELARTLVDFLAAVSSSSAACSFYESLLFAGTWLFLIGSILRGAPDDPPGA
ncbi:MAG: N-acetyl-gamma-glutamyl-phosphate reductase [Alphaproteobacteria bacterium]|nr:N-acetyl-gamma-glutamyl-phosphate reductase [Alphaproteobacteria bacterium]